MRRKPRTIIALDPTSRGMAYAVFSASELVDWGQRACGRSEEAALDFVDGLVTDEDATLVIEDWRATSRRCERVVQLLRRIARLAEERKLTLLVIPRRAVKAKWAAYGFTNKEAVAAALARRFPELAPYVPPPRKPWMSEQSQVNIFDAVALATDAMDERSKNVAC